MRDVRGFLRGESSFPRLISGVGILLGLILFGELLVLGVDSSYDGFRAGAITSIPFIVGLVYAGRWLDRSDIPVERYDRIARWSIAVCLGTTLLIGWINLTVQSLSLELVVGTIRWSGALGASVGLVIGVLQVRAIQGAIEAERARSRLQETEREREQLEEFTRVVSHDLRNPLDVAHGRLALAREECESEHLDHTEAALERMQELIEDLLTLARTGTEVRDPEPVDLAGLVEESRRNVVLADATVVTEIDRRIRADRGRLQQLLENLLGNAVEHGGSDVTITVGELEDGFYIEDDGPGIPEADRDDVFEAGYSTTGDGTGFGLSIVEQVATAHGWEVRVTEGPTGGARFEIRGVHTNEG